MSTAAADGNLLERMGDGIANVVERWMPSPFLFAILLTYVAYVAALIVEGTGPFETVIFWFDGFWIFLEFAMQMTLILMTGFVVAYHPRVNGILRSLTEIPNDGKQAVVLVGFVAMALAWVHWGLSLIIGAIFAREMGKTAYKNGINAHYPVLCVAGYMGLGLTWHWGLSGSAPLLLATDGNEFIDLGILDAVVPASATIFSTYALTLTVTSIIFACLVLYLLAPTGDRARDITAFVDESDLFDDEDAAAEAAEATDPVADGGEEADRVPADRINNSRIIGGIIALTGVAIVGYQFATAGLDALTLNLVNFGFLFVGLAIYTRPQYYRERFGEAASAAAGIILLFPFFAGIQGIMNFSGLSETIAEGLFAISTPETFPVIAWLAAAIVNVFVPSGGGEWIVLGPSVIEAAQGHGVPVGQATMAYAVGDAHTNLLNPFWALPLLAITGIKARQMFGYGIAMLLLLIPFLAVALTVIPY